MLYSGIDIGTTTICGAVIESDGCRCLEAITETNKTALPAENEWERLQAPEKIIGIVTSIADRLIGKYPDIAGIGVTGQMHGIVYVGKDGKSVSPLYTWQDGRGDRAFRNGKTYSQYMSERIGSKISSGYGTATHFYNTINGVLPDRAVSFCTISDYAVMRLCGIERPYMHASNAASLGCFDLKKQCFRKESAALFGFDLSFFPSVTSAATVTGRYRGIPVTVSLGDNQASFIGSGADADSVLVNIGTGSQISLISGYTETEGSIELRPFDGERYLLVGSSLSGGRAYAVLESLFRAVAEMVGAKPESMYPYMDKLLENCSEESTLAVSTLFDGTRNDPSARGSIGNIGISNFTPTQLMLGFLNGIATELYRLYIAMGAPAKSKLIGAGNGIRRNRMLQRCFQNCFDRDLVISPFHEEAACGAAIFASGGRE